MIHLDSKASKLLLDAERKLVLNDFQSFRKMVCGYHDFQPFHDIIDQVLLSESRYKKILIPRNHLKSSDVMAWILWSILRNPDISILYESSIYEQAKKYLAEMRHHIESPKWVELFGDWKGAPWADSKIQVSTRTKIQLAPTVSASGVDKSQTGQHYDLIVLDDIVDEKNSKTKELREKVINRYKQALSLMRPGGVIVLVGTRWDRDDLYGWIDSQEEIKNLFDSVLLDVYDLDGKIRFHQKFCETLDEERRDPTKRSLEGLRLQLGPYQFSCQYRLNPDSEDFAEFKNSWVKHKSRDEMKEAMSKDGVIRIFCDPALGKEHSKDPCDTAIVIANFLPNHTVHVLWTDAEICTPGDTVDKLHMFAMTYMKSGRSVEVYIEDVGFQSVLITQLEERRNRFNQYFQINAVRPILDKHRRIRGLFPFYQNGQIYHSEAIRRGKLEDQLHRFPKGDRVDLIDAFSQFTYMINWPLKKQQKELQLSGITAKQYYNGRAPIQHKRHVEELQRSMIGQSVVDLYRIGE